MKAPKAEESNPLIENADHNPTSHVNVSPSKTSKKALDKQQQGSTRPHNLKARPVKDESGVRDMHRPTNQNSGKR